jgi:hypothetical protein
MFILRKLSKIKTLNLLSWLAQTELRLIVVALMTLLTQEFIQRVVAYRRKLNQPLHEVG